MGNVGGRAFGSTCRAVGVLKVEPASTLFAGSPAGLPKGKVDDSKGRLESGSSCEPTCSCTAERVVRPAVLLPFNKLQLPVLLPAA